MIATIQHHNQHFKVDFSKPIDISMPLSTAPESTSAWYVDPIRIEPVRGDGFVGDVQQGGSVNFRDVHFNPHGNGTHTECVGHISSDWYSVNKALNRFVFTAQLISIDPEVHGEDRVITAAQIEAALGNNVPEALVIRTLPNDASKLHCNYSNTNPAYLHHEAAKLIVERGIQHLLLDLPSVDREVDNGELLAHRAFWTHPENTSQTRTITELVYIPTAVKDGAYLLDLHFAPFENDASPSRPVLYKIIIG